MLKGPFLSQRQSLILSLPRNKKLQALEKINRQLHSKVLNCLANLFSDVKEMTPSDLLHHFSEISSFTTYWRTNKSSNLTKRETTLNQIRNVLSALQKYEESNLKQLSPSQQKLITSFIEQLTMYQEVIHSQRTNLTSPLVFSTIKANKKEMHLTEKDIGALFIDKPRQNGLKKF